MTERLLQKWIPELGRGGDAAARARCGTLSGVTGIVLNLLLFGGKLAAGILSGAISVTADAFNNLSDAASSLLTAVGFRLAGRAADEDHPFGHGRMEYLTGLMVSFLIVLVGVELGKSSVDKILHPAPTQLTWVTGGILAASVAVKLWMGWFNRAMGRLIGSRALMATAKDSWADAAATAAVLAGLLLSRYTDLALDGWLGLLVAALILWVGVRAAQETLDPLLGKAPEADTVQAIRAVILSHRQVMGVHDLVIHDYGPGRRMMSVHAEVASDADLVEVHEVIDHIERELNRRFALEAVIHVDPVAVGNPGVDALRALTARLAAEVDPAITIHDFRLAAGVKRPTLLFDAEAPYSLVLSDEEIRRALSEKLAAQPANYRAIINVDRRGNG